MHKCLLYIHIYLPSGSVIYIRTYFFNAIVSINCRFYIDVNCFPLNEFSTLTQRILPYDGNQWAHSSTATSVKYSVSFSLSSHQDNLTVRVTLVLVNCEYTRTIFIDCFSIPTCSHWGLTSAQSRHFSKYKQLLMIHFNIHGSEDSSLCLPRYDTVQCRGRILSFRRALPPP
jgi:hypothetical protein